jgi:uncharacterized protein (DUF2126 family)
VVPARERCYLVPGRFADRLSPAARFAALGGQRPTIPYVIAPDPTQAFPPLPAAAQFAHSHSARCARRTRPQTGELAPSASPNTRRHARRRQARRASARQAFESAAWITRTAMCAEPRNGVLYLFMPPTETLDDYLELVAAVEATAEETASPVMLEGYEPPSDPRLTNFRVTPDPGVIEVNIQPGQLDELVERTTHLYEAAHLSRLGTEKFMLDGRHTGTGGGNHFVLGGATPADSPFLRRPTCCAA